MQLIKSLKIKTPMRVRLCMFGMYGFGHDLTTF